MNLLVIVLRLIIIYILIGGLTGLVHFYLDHYGTYLDELITITQHAQRTASSFNFNKVKTYMTNQEYIECMEKSMVQFKQYHHRINFIDPKYGFESLLAYNILNKLYKGTLINKPLSTLEYLALNFQLHHCYPIQFNENPICGKQDNYKEVYSIVAWIVLRTFIKYCLKCASFIFPNYFATSIFSNIKLDIVIIVAIMGNCCHKLAHRRNHKIPLWSDALVHWLQNIGILIHPNQHKIHHIHLNKHYAIALGRFIGFHDATYKLVFPQSIYRHERHNKLLTVRFIILFSIYFGLTLVTTNIPTTILKII